MQPLVGVIMGSRSDWETLAHAANTLDDLAACPTRCAWCRPIARRTCCSSTPRRRRRAGWKSSSPAPAARPICRAWRRPRRCCPCSACRSSRKALHGVDSLLSIVQMPAGVPVATLAIGRAGADQRRAAGDGHPRQQASAVPRSAAAVGDGTNASGPGPPRPAGERHEMVGVLGGGQLGRMLALAGYPLGPALPLSRSRRRSAGQAARPSCLSADFDDAASLDRSRPAWTSSPTSSRMCRSRWRGSWPSRSRSIRRPPRWKSARIA